MVDKVLSDLSSQTASGPVARRWREVRTGEFVPESNSPVRNLWASTVLVVAAGSDVSAWLDVPEVTTLLIARRATGGVYALEIDWSRDGVAVDITEAVVVASNTSITKPKAAKFFRARVRNTDATVAFTDHLTVING